MNKKIILKLRSLRVAGMIFCAVTTVVLAQAQNVFTMTDVVHRAQTQSPSFKQNETRRENRYWQYRYFRTNYNPQIKLNSNNSGYLYSNSFTPVRQPDGSIEYLS